MEDSTAAISTGSRIVYEDYKDERQLRSIQDLVALELSEPYSIFTYRYFLMQWPNLCVCAYDHGDGADNSAMIGAVIGKIDVDKDSCSRGYIGMLVVDKKYRKHGIGSILVKECIKRMVDAGCDFVYLETEASNKAALNLYERLGFAREDRMARYYLNGGDAFRLKLWIERPEKEDEGGAEVAGLKHVPEPPPKDAEV